MRSKLLFLAIALIFGVFAMLPCRTTGVGAIGASTNNTTMPNFPISDQSQNEIKPQVKYTLLGPSLQSKTTSPGVILGFIGPNEQDKFKIAANETWYLGIDINTPGWLYIYEYFPAGNTLQGKWIAYKWQLLQSGLWKLGPFTPDKDEPEGQHTYRVWFYSDGQWAEEGSADSQNNLVYWTYSKNQPAGSAVQQAPLQPPAPVKEAKFLDQLQGFITQPVVLVPGILLLVVVLGFYIYRKYIRWGGGENTLALPADVETEGKADVLSSAIASAKILLPNGMEMQLAGNSRVIGRGDLARSLGLDELGLISRQHFEVKSENEQFYIEDLGSANGTRLNGTDIGGKGPISLNNDDLIEPAGAIRLKFYII